MKYVMIIAILFTVSLGVAQTKQQKSVTKFAVATYTGNSTQGYYFTNDLDQSPMLFNFVRPKVLKEYDLSNSIYIRKMFRITYNMETVKGKTQMTIIALKLLDNGEENDIDD